MKLTRKTSKLLDNVVDKVMNLVKENDSSLDNMIDETLDIVKEESNYQIFFKKTLAKFGVSSPSQLDEKKKKKFFSMLKTWKKK
jgi:hypothetical protein